MYFSIRTTRSVVIHTTNLVNALLSTSLSNPFPEQQSHIEWKNQASSSRNVLVSYGKLYTIDSCHVQSNISLNKYTILRATPSPQAFPPIVSTRDRGLGCLAYCSSSSSPPPFPPDSWVTIQVLNLKAFPHHCLMFPS